MKKERVALGDRVTLGKGIDAIYVYKRRPGQNESGSLFFFIIEFGKDVAMDGLAKALYQWFDGKRIRSVKVEQTDMELNNDWSIMSAIEDARADYID